MQDFRKLIVWQRAQDTCVSIYKLTAAFPAEERYGICSQLRRAAVSVGANLAEGSKRQSNADKARIFNIAQGEAAEAMSILDVAHRLNYGPKGEALRYSAAYDELVAMIAALREKVAGTPRDSG
jgi:four helix bundle protein